VAARRRHCYGNNLEDAYRHNGIYVAHILGDKPAICGAVRLTG
jgi:hypothetical protein